VEERPEDPLATPARTSDAATPRRSSGDDTARPRTRTRLLNVLVALGVGALAGLIAHRLSGDEPLATEAQSAGHLFAELLIVVFAALIAYWLLEDLLTARATRKPPSP
jgi:hypothetical protein